MRIAQVIPSGAPPWSGVTTAVVNLSAALARRGHEVGVWGLHEWTPDDFADHLSQLEASGVQFERIRQAQPRWRLAIAAHLAEAAHRPDVVHLHSVFVPANTMIARVLHSPYVLSPHGGYAPVSLARSWARKAAYLFLFERSMLRRAALVVGLTTSEVEDVRRVGARGPFEVIPNGVAPPPDGIDPASFRRELGLDPTARLVLFVGRLDVFHKGLDDLLGGLASCPVWHLALVGPDHRGGLHQLTRLAETLHLSERVHFLGSRRERQVHEAFAAADLVALTSRWEGLPMSLLEGLAHGVPALVSPAVERLVGVEAADAGWMARPQDIAGTLRSLLRLHPQEWELRRDAARRLAQRYRWEAVARAYEAAYEQAVDHTSDGTKLPPIP